MRQQKWLVYEYFMKTYRYELVDEVYFMPDCDAHYVRMSLINHDGYSSSIKVVKA